MSTRQRLLLLAMALATYRWPLAFGGLADLKPDTAAGRELHITPSLRGGRLTLRGLTALDTETARALAACTCEMLVLNGLTSIDADTAKALSQYKGQLLNLYGLTALDAATAEAFAEGKVNRLCLQQNVPEVIR